MRGYRFGRFSLDAQAQRLMRDGEPVALKPKVFQLLLHLIESQGRLVSRSELMDRLWPNQDVPDANLTQSVYELRRALDDGTSPCIDTVARRGFRFSAKVEPIGGAEAPSPVRDARIASIVVMPFGLLPGGERDEVLEYGLCETLVTALSRVPGLRVRQPHWAAPGKPPIEDPLAAGRKVGVDAILLGTLHRAEKQLRVTVRLVRVTDGDVLWANQFDVSVADLLDVEREICDRVVNAVAAERPHGRSGRLLQPHADDPEVHELYLQCRYYWHLWRPDGWLRAIECGEEAIRRDPRHAPAYAWTGASYCILGVAGVLPPLVAFGKGASLVERSIELDESLAAGWEVRAAISHFHRWDPREARTSVRRSLELDPVRVPARGLNALVLCMTGQPDEGLREIEEARNGEPLSLIANMALGEVRMVRREFDAAATALEHTLSLDRFYVQARLFLGETYAALGRHEEALAAFQEAVEHMGAAGQPSPHIGYGLALTGDRDGALAVRDKLVAAAAEQFVDPIGLALVSIGLEDHDEAFRWLAAAVEQRSSRLVYARVHPVYDPLRGDRRFDALLEQIGV